MRFSSLGVFFFLVLFINFLPEVEANEGTVNWSTVLNFFLIAPLIAPLVSYVSLKERVFTISSRLKIRFAMHSSRLLRPFSPNKNKIMSNGMHAKWPIFNGSIKNSNYLKPAAVTSNNSNIYWDGILPLQIMACIELQILLKLFSTHKNHAIYVIMRYS